MFFGLFFYFRYPYNFNIRPFFINFAQFFSLHCLLRRLKSPILYLMIFPLKEDMDIPKFAIVVGRQYGAGARRMAAELARRLGAAYYDKELLDEAARRLGYHLSLFSAADERRPSMLRGMWLHGFGMGGGTDALSGETLFQVQADVLRDIAERGNCVIVGRAADYVLRHHPKLVSIFLHAPAQHRAANIVSRGECDNVTAATEIARRHDRRREEFYNYFTGSHRWGRAHNYDLTLDASHFDADALTDFVMKYLEARGIRPADDNK